MVEPLDEIAKTVEVNPEKHWIVPNVARAGGRIDLGGEKQAQRLTGAEMAVAVATGTRFMESIPVGIFGKVMYVTDDPLIPVTNMMKILAGRGLKSCQDINMIPWKPENNPESLLEEMSTVDKPKLIVLDGALPYAWIDLRYLEIELRTTLLALGKADLRPPATMEIHAEFEPVRKNLAIRHGGFSKPLVRAHMRDTKEAIFWERLPVPETMTRFQEAVFLAVQRLKFATVSDIRKELKMRSSANISKALRNLQKDMYLVAEKQDMGMKGKTVNIWSTNV